MVFVVFLTVVSVFALTLVIVHFALRSHTISQADGMTQIISRYNGEVPEMQEYEQDALQGIWGQIIFTEESPFRTRYLVAYFNEAMEVEMINIEHVASISAETARAMAEKAISGKDTVGYIDAYRFRIAATGDGQLYVIFLDCSESFASQRVTDTVLGASHELKTPLAIISANAEVLAYKDGGINPKYLFDRFYRPDSARTSSKGGHGIGLSIVKKITVLHNGSISARQIDGGICFTVELPPMHEGKRSVSG